MEKGVARNQFLLIRAAPAHGAPDGHRAAVSRELAPSPHAPSPTLGMITGPFSRDLQGLLALGFGGNVDIRVYICIYTCGDV